MIPAKDFIQQNFTVMDFAIIEMKKQGTVGGQYSFGLLQARFQSPENPQRNPCRRLSQYLLFYNALSPKPMRSPSLARTVRICLRLCTFPVLKGVINIYEINFPRERFAEYQDCLQNIC